MPKTSAWSPHMLSILRIVTGLLYVEHGLVALTHFPTAPADLPNPLPPLAVAAATIDLVGGGLITLGLFTRAAAFICAGEMAVGYFLVHASKSFWPAINKGEAAILFCFIFLYLVCSGGGAWSLDRAVRKVD